MAVRSTDPLPVRVRASLARVDPPIERPDSLVRLAVAACVAVTVVLGLVYFVRAVDRLGDEASRNAATSYDERQLGGANALGLDEEALVETRAWIPAHGTYRVVAGPGTPEIELYARYFLMPRRPDRDARWVLCYECDLSRLGPLDVVWRNDAGLALVRLAA